MKIEMGTHQVEALDKIRNGCILHGGTAHLETDAHATDLSVS